jgi:hypothetical protein
LLRTRGKETCGMLRVLFILPLPSFSTWTEYYESTRRESSRGYQEAVDPFERVRSAAQTPAHPEPYLLGGRLSPQALPVVGAVWALVTANNALVLTPPCRELATNGANGRGQAQSGVAALWSIRGQLGTSGTRPYVSPILHHGVPRPRPFHRDPRQVRPWGSCLRRSSPLAWRSSFCARATCSPQPSFTCSQT